MPAASEAADAPGGGGGGDVEQEEFEIRNDDGFVYRVPKGRYPDPAPSTTQSSAGPDPKAAGLRRRRRALLRLRAKRLRELSRWEALASELAAPLPAPQPPALPSQSPPAPSPPVAAAAASSSASVLDDLLARVDMQAELMEKVLQLCDEANAICDEGEAAIIDSFHANPLDLVTALSRPDGNAPGNLDGQNRLQEASGVPSAAVEMIKSSVKKQKMGHDLPPTKTDSRTTRATNLSGSNNVASQASNESKRKKAPGSTSAAPGTPGSTTRTKATTPARARETFSSSGPLTRTRAAAQKLDWRY